MHSVAVRPLPRRVDLIIIGLVLDRQHGAPRILLQSLAWLTSSSVCAGCTRSGSPHRQTRCLTPWCTSHFPSASPRPTLEGLGHGTSCIHCMVCTTGIIESSDVTNLYCVRSPQGTVAAVTAEPHDALLQQFQWYVDPPPWQTHRTALPHLHRPIQKADALSSRVCLCPAQPDPGTE